MKTKSSKYRSSLSINQIEGTKLNKLINSIIIDKNCWFLSTIFSNDIHGRLSKSCANLNFHSWIKVKIDFWFLVVAVHALTILCALQTSIETFTILFSAQRFFACAFTCWNMLWDPFEVSWLPVIHNTLWVYDLLLVPSSIVALNANTVRIT